MKQNSATETTLTKVGPGIANIVAFKCYSNTRHNHESSNTYYPDYRPELDALDNNLSIFTDGLRFCAS